MTSKQNTYADLELIKKIIFNPCDLNFSNFDIESESQEYAACTFQLNGQHIKFRTAKTTATKNGQFVTLWKRNKKGITAAFDIADNIDFYMISSRQHDHFGLFIFPKSVLHDNKILSVKDVGGKRGIRVYPDWCLPTSKQAAKTQYWQKKYFMEIGQDTKVDSKKVMALFNIST